MMGGFFPGLPPATPTKGVHADAPDYEKLVTGAQEIAVGWLDGCSELVHRATYYTLWAQGYRIPTSPHDDLLRCARKEFKEGLPSHG